MGWWQDVTQLAQYSADGRFVRRPEDQVPFSSQLAQVAQTAIVGQQLGCVRIRTADQPSLAKVFQTPGLLLHIVQEDLNRLRQRPIALRGQEVP